MLVKGAPDHLCIAKYICAQKSWDILFCEFSWYATFCSDHLLLHISNWTFISRIASAQNILHAKLHKYFAKKKSIQWDLLSHKMMQQFWPSNLYNNPQRNVARQCQHKMRSYARTYADPGYILVGYMHDNNHKLLVLAVLTHHDAGTNLGFRIRVAPLMGKRNIPWASLTERDGLSVPHGLVITSLFFVVFVVVVVVVVVVGCNPWLEEIMAWLSNYIPLFCFTVIIYACLISMLAELLAW